jgi:hypothetical protein
MRWLLSLIIGLLLAWVIVLSVPRNTSYFESQLDPTPINKLEESLVGVGLAHYPPTKSIMDSINHPVPFSYGPAPNLNVIKGSSPDPNFTPNSSPDPNFTPNSSPDPNFTPNSSPAPSPVTPGAPMSAPMSNYGSPSPSPVFNSPAPVTPAAGPGPSPAPAPSS